MGRQTTRQIESIYVLRLLDGWRYILGSPQGFACRWRRSKVKKETVEEEEAWLQDAEGTPCAA